MQRHRFRQQLRAAPNCGQFPFVFHCIQVNFNICFRGHQLPASRNRGRSIRPFHGPPALRRSRAMRGCHLTACITTYRSILAGQYVTSWTRRLLLAGIWSSLCCCMRCFCVGKFVASTKIMDMTRDACWGGPFCVVVCAVCV